MRQELVLHEYREIDEAQRPKAEGQPVADALQTREYHDGSLKRDEQRQDGELRDLRRGRQVFRGNLLLLGQKVGVEVAGQQVELSRKVTPSFRSAHCGIANVWSTDIDMMLRPTLTNSIFHSSIWRIGGCCMTNSQAVVSSSNWRVR
jgi:hypothetical protein